MSENHDDIFTYKSSKFADRSSLSFHTLDSVTCTQLTMQPSKLACKHQTTALSVKITAVLRDGLQAVWRE